MPALRLALSGLASFVLVAGFAPRGLVAQDTSTAIEEQQGQKKYLAETLRRELEEIYAALDAYASGRSPALGAVVSFDELKAALKPGSALAARRGLDPLGTPYGRFVAGEKPRVPATSALVLERPRTFWTPFETEPTAGVKPAAFPRRRRISPGPGSSAKPP